MTALPTGTEPLRHDDPSRLGRFQLLGRLGHGGMGMVYLASAGNDTFAAVKVLHPHLAADANMRRLLRREADSTSRIASANVPRLIELGEADGGPYLAMQYLPGTSLAVRTVRQGLLCDAELTAVAVGVAGALADVHRAGLVHYDVKPANVVLSPSAIFLIDFGIAHPTTTVTARVPTGLVFGSPSSMAPEQFTGASVTTATDIFAWASLVAYAATGRYPFGSDDAARVAHRIVHAKPDHRRLPAPLDDLVRALFAKGPQRRPTAAQLYAALGPQAALTAGGGRGIEFTHLPETLAVTVACPALALCSPRGHRWP